MCVLFCLLVLLFNLFLFVSFTLIFFVPLCSFLGLRGAQHSIEILAHIEFTSMDHFYCTSDQLVKGVCPVENGQQALDSFGMGSVNVGRNIGIILALLAAYRVVTYLALRFYRPKVK